MSGTVDSGLCGTFEEMKNIQSQVFQNNCGLVQMQCEKKLNTGKGQHTQEFVGVIS